MKILYITCRDREQAREIGKTLVTERLVACVNILGEVESMYEWEGNIQREREVALIAKTTTEQCGVVIERVVELHDYSCPCVVVLPIEKGYPPFLDWVKDTVNRSN